MSKEIMQQALDALEGFAYHGKAEGWPETITALRAALAAPQPEPVGEVISVREPVAGTWGQVHTSRQVRWRLSPPPEGTKLYAAPLAAPQPAPVIAGALFDFLGWLTSRDEVTTLHSRADAGVAVRVLEQWAKLRGLSLDDARVLDWQQPAAPSGKGEK